MEGNTVERAFALARSGRYRSIDDIRRALMKEQYAGVQEHLDGASIKRELLAVMKASREPTGE